MDSKTLATLVGALVSCIHHGAGSEYCDGHFYKTKISSYYGRYYITTDYHHDSYYFYNIYFYYTYSYYSYYYRYSANYRFDGTKYCEDKCCTIEYNGDYSYKYCCTEYGVTPSYKSSSRPSSTTGFIVGCTFGGVLFVGFVIFSLIVFRCMWNDTKRINPIPKTMDLNNTTETAVAMEDVLVKDSSSAKHQSPNYHRSEEDIV